MSDQTDEKYKSHLEAKNLLVLCRRCGKPELVKEALLRKIKELLKKEKSQEFLHNPWIIHNNKLVTSDGNKITIHGRDHPITQDVIECHKAIYSKRDQIIIDDFTKP